MEFDYTEEQVALQDTLQKFVARDYDFDKRRGFARSALGYSPSRTRRSTWAGFDP